MNITVGDLLKSVPEGESQSFKASQEGAADTRFVEVAYNWQYCTIARWNNMPDLEQMPWLGSRVKSRVGFDDLPEPDLTYSGRMAGLVDFHTFSSGTYIVSDKLLKVIEAVDPHSLEVRRVVMKTRDGQVPFNMVMPLRLLDAIDPDICDVDVLAYELGPQWFYRLNFPNGVMFREDIDPAIQHFSDLDLPRWFWSRDLFARAKEEGVRGVIARPPNGAASQQLDKMYQARQD